MKYSRHATQCWILITLRIILRGRITRIIAKHITRCLTINQTTCHLWITTRTNRTIGRDQTWTRFNSNQVIISRPWVRAASIQQAVSDTKEEVEVTGEEVVKVEVAVNGTTTTEEDTTVVVEATNTTIIHLGMRRSRTRSAIRCSLTTWVQANSKTLRSAFLATNSRTSRKGKKHLKALSNADAHKHQERTQSWPDPKSL